MASDVNPTGTPVEMPENRGMTLNSDYHTLLFYRQLFEWGDLVFDVGANVGARSETFLMLGAKVVAFEPQPGLAHFMDRFKGLDQLTFIPAALGAEPGTAEMTIAQEHCASTLSDYWVNESKHKGCNWLGKETVKVGVLDDYIDEYGMPKFIKIDVEGYESEVLKGLTKEVPCFCIECESTDRSIDCLDMIDSRYECEYQFVVGENRFYALTEWVKKEQVVDFIKWAMPQDPNFFGDIYIRSKRLHEEAHQA